MSKAFILEQGKEIDRGVPFAKNLRSKTKFDLIGSSFSREIEQKIQRPRVNLLILEGINLLFQILLLRISAKFADMSTNKNSAKAKDRGF